MDGKNNYVYKCIDISNYDGDSFRLTILKQWDFGFGIHVEQKYQIATRIYGIDTPELRDKRADFKAAGYLAKEKAAEWVKAERTQFISLDKPDKYGRALGDFRRESGFMLSDYLIENNYAVAYKGQNKELVEWAHQKNIEQLKERGEL